MGAAACARLFPEPEEVVFAVGFSAPVLSPLKRYDRSGGFRCMKQKRSRKPHSDIGYVRIALPLAAKGGERSVAGDKGDVIA